MEQSDRNPALREDLRMGPAIGLLETCSVATGIEVADAMNGGPAKVRSLVELATVARLRGTAAGDESATAWHSQAEQLADQLGLPTLVPTVA